MPDYRVDDSQHAKERWRRVGLAALGLWTAAGSYAMSPAVLSDGWVPDHWVASWPQGRRLAKALVDADEWRAAERDGLPGYEFADWSGQTPAAKFLADREAARKRMRDIRQGKRSRERSSEQDANVPPKFERSSEEVRRLPVPHPTDEEQLGGDRPVSDRASAQRPPERCPKHRNSDNPPNCGACGDSRRAAQAWDAHAPRRAAADAAAIRACRWCNADGWRWLDPEKRYRGPATGPGARCDHTALVGAST